MRHVLSRVFLPVSLVILMLSCQKQDEISTSNARGGSTASASKKNTFYGAQVTLGNGKARSFITITHAGVPVEYGIIMTANTMHGLPTDGMDHEGNTYYLPLHPKVSEVTPFSFIMMNWNPQGHEPPFIYGLPHFDFHFYTGPTREEVMTYMPGPAMEKAPPAGYLHPDYISPGPGVPMMGKHWTDKFSPELPPTLAKFDKTFVFGTYDGKVVFYEPMITRTLLMSNPSYELPIKQPTYFSPADTYYPTAYKIYTDPKTGEIIVSLSGFTWR